MSRILVVEDQATLREGYAAILSKAGHNVFVAADGMTAVAEAERVNPDLILLDLLMPVMDGIAFLRQYDLRRKHPNVVVVIFSNSSAPGKVQEAMDLGASRYLVKAIVSPKKLIKIVEEELGTPTGGDPSPPKP
jgi:CheY-like chemotaxis protein